MPTDQQQEKLLTAYAALLGRGERVTVRALKAEAKVGTDVALAWYRTSKPAASVPKMSPVAADALNTAAKVMWSAAWREALEGAYSDVDAQLNRALEDQAAAEESREQAEKAAQEAQDARQKAVDLAAEQTAALAAAEAQIAALQAENVRLRETAGEADRRAAAAEATSATLQSVLSNFFTKTETPAGDATHG